jgi:hypothetical protein
MKPWQSLQVLLRLTSLAALVYLAWVFGGRVLDQRRRANFSKDTTQSEANAAFLNTYGGTAVRILQFYARDGALVEGHSTVLCYGVLNAKSVRIEPPVEGASPALNRCLEIAPLHDTRYTMTAESNDGHTVSASFTLPVGPDKELLPRISSFGIARKGVDGGRSYFVLSFSVENAVTVDVDPPVIPTLHGAPLGQFTVAPEKSTTYTLTVTGKHGHKVTRQLTVTV